MSIRKHSTRCRPVLLWTLATMAAGTFFAAAQTAPRLVIRDSKAPIGAAFEARIQNAPAGKAIEWTWDHERLTPRRRGATSRMVFMALQQGRASISARAGEWSQTATVEIVAPPARATGTAGPGVAVMSRKHNAMDNAMRNYLAQQGGIRFMLEPDTIDEFFSQLAHLTADGKQAGSLVILGHGSRDRPHIELKSEKENEELVPADFARQDHRDLLAKYLEVRRNGKRDYAELSLKKGLSEEDKRRLAYLERHIENSRKTIEKEIRALERLEQISSVMAPGARILLLNCSAAATEEGLRFVRDIGRAFLWKRGGEIVASREDLNLFQLSDTQPNLKYGTLPGYLWSEVQGVGTLVHSLLQGKIVPLGDYYLTSGWADWWFNWVTLKVESEEDPGPLDHSLFVETTPLLQKAVEGEAVTVTAAPRPAADSGRFTYSWDYKNENTPEPTYRIDTRHMSEGLHIVHVRVKDARGREGEDIAFFAIGPPVYKLQLSASEASPRFGTMIRITAMLTEGAKPADALWGWRYSGGLRLVSRKGLKPAMPQARAGAEAAFEVQDAGAVRVVLYRLGEFGKEHVLAEAALSIKPSGERPEPAKPKAAPDAKPGATARPGATKAGALDRLVWVLENVENDIQNAPENPQVSVENRMSATRGKIKGSAKVKNPDPSALPENQYRLNAHEMTWSVRLGPGGSFNQAAAPADDFPERIPHFSAVEGRFKLNPMNDRGVEMSIDHGSGPETSKNESSFWIQTMGWGHAVGAKRVLRIGLKHPGGTAFRKYAYVLSEPGAVAAPAFSVKIQCEKPEVAPGEETRLKTEVKGGEPPYKFEWNGASAAAEGEAAFSQPKPGTYPVGVKVTDRTNKAAEGSVTVRVGEIKAVLRPAGPQKTTVGGKLAFEVDVLLDGKPAAAPYEIRWEPHPEVEFAPHAGVGRRTSATFKRLGPVKVWADVLRATDGALQTLAETAQVEVQVAAPQLSMRFDPSRPYVGQDVKARIVVAPPAGPEYVDIRWLPLPEPARQFGASQDSREISFWLGNAKPVKVEAAARVPYFGDDLGSAAATLTARAFDVKVAGPFLSGANSGAPPAAGGGTANAAAAPLPHQMFSFRARVSPAPFHPPLRYAWSIDNEEGTIHNPFSETISVTCREPGTYRVSVTVRDERDAELGSGTGFVTVEAPPPPALGDKKKKTDPPPVKNSRPTSTAPQKLQ